MTEMPDTVCDSMFFTLLTAERHVYSLKIVICFSMSGVGKPAVEPHDVDHGDIDLGEDVRRRRHRRPVAQERDEEGHDDERVRFPEREFDDPHGSVLLSVRSVTQARGLELLREGVEEIRRSARSPSRRARG
jgi:hypothetical protein